MLNLLSTCWIFRKENPKFMGPFRTNVSGWPVQTAALRAEDQSSTGVSIYVPFDGAGSSEDFLICRQFDQFDLLECKPW